MVSSIGGNSSVADVLRQQSKQVANQQDEQRIKDQQDANRQALERERLESSNNQNIAPDARKGGSVDITA